MDLVQAVEREQFKKNVPEFRAGDTLKVFLKVVEGDKSREQAFEGICIDRKHSGLREAFTVRKISANGVGVERTLLIHSPNVLRIDVLRRGDVSKARLYYLRDKVGKQARVKERRAD